MKKLLFILIFMSVFFITEASYGAAIITSPLDSRPISTDYLKNLAEIYGDNVLYPDKEIMDCFSATGEENYFADSEKIRREIRELVSQNNNSDTVVIINTSTYFSKGLVGSRCGINYKNEKKAMAELKALMQDYPEPKYYINLTMPRTLPETRLNNVWFNEKSINGLGYYYLRSNPECENKEYIKQNFKTVTPVQFLMEYSYLENKRTELGEEGLKDYENDFLKAFEALKKYEPYKSYLYYYKLPYFTTADMFSQLMIYQDMGLVDEIIVSNDDFQLPDSIVYFNSLGEEWVTQENNSPVKFSFARTYMSSGVYSIVKQIKNQRGEKEAEAALKAENDKINFIFGTDEVPQLIYARALAQKTGMTTDFNIIADKTDKVDTFDVASVNALAENAASFVKGLSNNSINQSDVYLYNYNNAGEGSMAEALDKINTSIESGNNTGVIEIYSTEILNTGENSLFKTLVENAQNKAEPSAADLGFYSAWNTNANAIGLGIAHAQVYSIAKNAAEDKSAMLKAHIKMLTQHLIEDGVYTCNTKRMLSNEGYIPTSEDRSHSKKLVDTMAYERVLEGFENKTYTIDDKQYTVKEESLKEYSFPWGRTFECYLDFNVDLTEE